MAVVRIHRTGITDSALLGFSVQGFFMMRVKVPLSSDKAR
jgi:hypothetical protein